MTLTAEQKDRLARPRDRRAYQAAWRESRREHVRARERAKYLRNREAVLDAVRRRKYGVTNEWVSATWEMQSRSCAICFDPIVVRSAHLDHDHKTGRVRGLLCARCNLRLSVIEDRAFAVAATEYLGRYI